MTALTPTIRVPQLSEADQDVLTGLLHQMARTTTRNLLRRRYYDHKNVLKDLGIAIPPALKSVETVVGWPSKAVDVLARRVRLEGFHLTGLDLDSTEFGVILDDNRTILEAEQAITSALVMAPAFLSVSAGDSAAGEPRALITARSALFATGQWDGRRRCLKSGLSITSVDSATGQPDGFVMHLPNQTIICRRSGVSWDVRQVTHDLGVPMEPLPFRPELDRPFGRSRITRGVMSITDRAVRTALRSEVSAEFFSAPQRYALGADEQTFTDSDGNQIPGWVSIIGRLLTISKDEDGDLPTVGQFTQQSFTPHLDHMRELAAEFAAETDLMPDTLGVIQDNPSSSEAIDQRKEELRLTAESCIGTFGAAYNRTARTVLAMMDGSPAAMAQWRKVRSTWRNPATPSRASAADATVKLVQSGILPATSEVTYDGLNLTDDQRRILRDERAATPAALPAAS